MTKPQEQIIADSMVRRLRLSGLADARIAEKVTRAGISLKATKDALANAYARVAPAVNGGGRPPLPEGQKKLNITTTLSQAAVDKVDRIIKREEADGKETSRSAVINRLILQSTGKL